MKVYNASSYGHANLMIRPGLDEPKNKRWFKLETDERGELRRIARQLVISFDGGAAEVEDELGRYLLEKQLVSAEPVPFTAPASVDAPVEWKALYEHASRKPPIAVGSPMTPEAAASQARWLGERIRV